MEVSLLLIYEMKLYLAVRFKSFCGDFLVLDIIWRLISIF